MADPFVPAPTIRVGRLRWPIIICRRPQEFDAPGGVSIFERFIEIQRVRADVQQVGALTFYGVEQVDTPFTHRIFIRWLSYLDQTNAILRETRLGDGSSRFEVFRVRRIGELGGRKRFAMIEAELEKTTTQPAGSAK